MSQSTELYDAFAPYYQEYSNDRTLYLESINNIIVQFITGHDIRGRMLDVGSGNGRRALDIAEKAGLNDLTLMDSSEEMTKLCRQLDGVTVVRGDICGGSVHLRVEGYSVVTCLWNVWGHIGTPLEREKAVRNIYRALSPGGFVFLDVNNRYNSRQYGLRNAFTNIWKDMVRPSVKNGDVDFLIHISSDKQIPAHVHLFSPREIDALFQKGGFFKRVTKRYVDYSSGEGRRSFLSGQLFYVFRKQVVPQGAPAPKLRAL